jgi:predicted porin
MNKKLLAVAVGAALAASAAVTQADVKVYGVAHVSVDYVDVDMTPPAEVTNPLNVANNSSRFGVKVKEDVGGGWAGLAQYELFTDNTESALTVNTNRNNFVGIEQKSIGQLLIGRMDSAQKDVGGIADLFFREALGESRAIINYGGGDSRNNESVTFNSAKLGPATFKIQWFGNDSQVNTNNGFDVNVKIALKPVTVGVGYWNTENAGEDTDGYRLAVKAPIGPVTLAALYQQVNSIGAVVGADRAAYGIGAAFKFLGSNTVKAQYYVADAADNAVVDNGANQLSVGYDYNFSKTTVVYVSYAKVSNDTAGTFSIGGNGHGETYTPIAGGEASGFSFGTRIVF